MIGLREDQDFIKSLVAKYHACMQKTSEERKEELDMIDQLRDETLKVPVPEIQSVQDFFQDKEEAKRCSDLIMNLKDSSDQTFTQFLDYLSLPEQQHSFSLELRLNLL